MRKMLFSSMEIPSGLIVSPPFQIWEIGNWKSFVSRADTNRRHRTSISSGRHGLLRDVSSGRNVFIQSARIIQRSSDRSEEKVSSAAESRASEKNERTNEAFFFISTSFQDEIVRQLKEREQLRRESEVLDQMVQFQSKQRETSASKWSSFLRFVFLETSPSVRKVPLISVFFFRSMDPATTAVITYLGKSIDRRSTKEKDLRV